MFSKVDKTAFRCSNEHFGRKFFLKNSSSVFFHILSETFPDFRQKFYGEIVKTDFYMIRKLFEETDFFNFLLFLLHIRILGKSSLWHLAQLFLLSCQICILRVQTNTLMKKYFFWKTPLNFFDFDQNLFWLSAKAFWKRCRNRFLHIQKTFRRNRLFHFFFGFVTFSDPGQNFSKFLHKFSRKVVKTAIYVFRRTVWWKKGKFLKIFFSKIEQFFSCRSAKNFPQRWQNCFVSVKTNTLMYNNFFENVFFFLFRFLAENLLIFNFLCNVLKTVT